MDLGAYLDRVAFAGAPQVDLDTLIRLHRGHLENIPYENLDVLLRKPLDFDIERIFDKLVVRRRGGWCYEMNGLLVWALEEIGFRVTRLAGAVRRDTLGDWVIGNHLVLLVHLQQDFIADVGFGDGLYEPVPLAPGQIEQRGFQSAFEQVEDGWWRYHNHQNGGAPSFDFRAESAQTAVLAERCAFLQTSEASPFTQNAIIQRRFGDRVEVLRNSLRVTARPDGADRGVIADAEEYVATLRDVFGLDLPEARSLWPLAERRGGEMLAAESSMRA